MQLPRLIKVQDLDKNRDALSSCASLTHLENANMVLLYKAFCGLTLLCLFFSPVEHQYIYISIDNNAVKK